MRHSKTTNINSRHNYPAEYDLSGLNTEELNYLNFRRSQDQKHQK